MSGGFIVKYQSGCYLGILIVSFGKLCHIVLHFSLHLFTYIYNLQPPSCIYSSPTPREGHVVNLRKALFPVVLFVGLLAFFLAPTHTVRADDDLNFPAATSY